MATVSEANRSLVLEMYREVLIAMDPAAVDQYMAPDYIQHSPLAVPGVAGLKAFLAEVKVASPEAKWKILRTLADGDLVAVHVHTTRFDGDPGLAVIDIFRCQDGKVAEHWEVIQEVPADSLNPISMF